MRIVFFGTPDYAAGALEALLEAGHEITAVVTQPDRPKGRSGEPVPSPVKVCAVKHQIPVMQPRRIKRPAAIEELKQYPAEAYVVAAFGQIIEGMDVVDKIAQVQTDYMDRPMKEQKIRSVTVDTMGVEYPEPETC